MILTNIYNTVIFKDESTTTEAALKAAIKQGISLNRANLDGANLNGANLDGANLNGASLYGANLNGANLNRANLNGANLYRASLYRASLNRANLDGANLNGASLYGANLNRANLNGANLDGASLDGASLDGANLDGANLNRASLNRAKFDETYLLSIYNARTILPEGELIGWKKLNNGIICKLKIPITAKRVGGLTGRKCRAEYAEVLEGSGESRYSEKPSITYTPGKIVTPDSFDPDVRVECAAGIHFFITKQEAENY